MYPYEAHFQWKWVEQFNPPLTIPDQNTLTNALIMEMQSRLSALFQQKLASTGHSFQITSVNTTIGNYSVSGNTVNIGNVTPCETVIYFLLDVAGGSTIVVFNMSSSESQGPLGGGQMTMLKIWIFDPTTGQTTAGTISTGSSWVAPAAVLGILAVAGLAAYASLSGRPQKHKIKRR
jgi:hypothetical protein